MSTQHELSDPTDQMVCSFADRSKARNAKLKLIEFGYRKEDVRLLGNSETDVDTSAKWFADTEVELKMFERELDRGKTLLIVPVRNADDVEAMNGLLKSEGAFHVTYFGSWTTQVMRYSDALA